MSTGHSTLLSLTSPGARPAPPLSDPFWDQVDVAIDFAMIGASKCGGSWLYGLLSQHPGVFIPNEQNFFTTNRHRGVASYNKLYARQPAGVRLGDYSSSFLLDDGLPAALAARFPGIKAIMLCRHPVERAFSQYLMDLRHGAIDKSVSFEAALASPPQHSYYDFGLYAKHARRWREHLGEDNVRVVLFDDLTADPHATVAGIFEFLDVDPSVEIDPEASYRNTAATQQFHDHRAIRTLRNTVRPMLTPRVRRAVEPIYWRWLHRTWSGRGPAKPEMAATTRGMLVEAYRKPNAELADMIDRDLGHWSR